MVKWFARLYLISYSRLHGKTEKKPVELKGHC